MPEIATPLTGPAGNPSLPIITVAQAVRLGGVDQQRVDLAALNAAVSVEAANVAITAPIWPNGTRLRVASEPVGVERIWNSSASHARQCALPNGKTITLAASSNTVLSTTGKPANGTGTDGDYAIDSAAGLQYGPKAAGVWPVGVALFCTVIVPLQSTNTAAQNTAILQGMIDAITIPAATTDGQAIGTVLIFNDDTFNINPIKINPFVSLVGQGYRKTVFLCDSTTEHAFYWDDTRATPADNPDNKNFYYWKFSGMTIICPRGGLRINKPGNTVKADGTAAANYTESRFKAAAIWVGCEISDLEIIGDYDNTSGDPSFETGDAADMNRVDGTALGNPESFGDPVSSCRHVDNLNAYGVGLMLTKLYESRIVNVEIESYGIGMWLDGCDLSYVLQGRMAFNGNHMLIVGHDTYGKQVTVHKPFFGPNHRRPAILAWQADFLTIDDCYFEHYTVAGEKIKVAFGTGIRILNNRFDGFQGAVTTPTMTLEPVIGLLVADNKGNPRAGDGAPLTINIKPTYSVGLYSFEAQNGAWAAHTQDFLTATFRSNTQMKVLHCPNCRYDHYDPFALDQMNPKAMAAVGADNQWSSSGVVWVASNFGGNQFAAAGDNYRIYSSASNLIVFFEPSFADTGFKLVVVGRNVNGGTVTGCQVLVDWDSWVADLRTFPISTKRVLTGSLSSLTSTTAIVAQTFTFTRHATPINTRSLIAVKLVSNSNVDIYGIKLIPQ